MEWIYLVWSGYFSYGVDISRMEWIFLVWSGYISYGVDISRMEWVFLVWSGYFSYGGDISRIAKHEPKTWSLITEINKENDVINVWSGFLSG
jgi:hypothetical protein